MTASVNVIGAGLAGSEAAWQIANQGVKVRLYEMRPQKLTPAHHTENFAELVCTNSLRARNANFQFYYYGVCRQAFCTSWWCACC